LSTQVQSWSKHATRTVWLIAAIGAIFRLVRWYHWRALWLDEIMLSYSIIHRGWHDLLFTRLMYWQIAPVGFLAAVKICTLMFGAGERALRLPSLLAALAALPLFIGVIRRTLSPRGGMLAMSLFAVLPPIVYYAQEVKQYGFDVLASLAVIYTAIRVMQDSQRRVALWIYFWTGAAAIFLSHAAVFVLAGTGLTLAARQLFRPVEWRLSQRLQSLLPLLGIAAGWGILEGLNYHCFLSLLALGPIHDGLVKSWEDRDGYMPCSPIGAAIWIWNSFRRIIYGNNTMWIQADQLAELCAIVGMAAWWKYRRWGLMLLLMPVLAAMLASLARHYPFADRLVLWTVPACTLLIAAGLDWLCGQGDRPRLGFGILVALIIGLPSLAVSGWYLADSRNGGSEESKPACQYIARHWQRGDVLYLYREANLSFYYYSQQPDVNLTGLKPLQMRECKPGPSLPAEPDGPRGAQADSPYGGWAGIAEFYSYPCCLQEYPEAPGAPAAGDLGYYIVQDKCCSNRADCAREIAGLQHPPTDWRWPPIHRIWVMFTHVYPRNVEDSDAQTLMELDQRFTRLPPGPFHAKGASVYLYDAAPAATPAEGFSPRRAGGL